jgi:hypothetical protein
MERVHSLLYGHRSRYTSVTYLAPLTASQMFVSSQYNMTLKESWYWNSASQELCGQLQRVLAYQDAKRLLDRMSIMLCAIVREAFIGWFNKKRYVVS